MSIMNNFQWQSDAKDTLVSESFSGLKEHSDVVVLFTIGLMKATRAMANELDRHCVSDWRSQLQEKLELDVKKDADFWPLMPDSETACYDAVLAGIEEALCASTISPEL